MTITLSALRCLGAVNAVSLYVERGGMTFDGVHVAVAARVARLARVNRVERLIPAISLREERPPLTNTPSHSCRAAPLPGMGLLIQTLISWTSSWASGDVINFKYETLAELRPLYEVDPLASSNSALERAGSELAVPFAQFHHRTRVASFKAPLSITRPLGIDAGEADDDLTCRAAILGRQCRELLIAQARVILGGISDKGVPSF